MKSGMKLLGSVVWVLTALAALHLGLVALGYNVLSLANLGNLEKPLAYVFGLSGVASLVMFFMPGCCESDKCN